jgi:Ca2+/Na+ antiporter
MFVLIGLQATQGPSRWWLAVPVALLFAFLLALPWGIETAASRTSDAYYREALSAIQFSTLYNVFVVAVALFLLWLIVRPRVDTPYKLAATGALTAATLAGLVVPVLGSIQEPVKAAATLARERNYDVVMWGINAPSFSVYYGRATAIRTPRAGDVVITRSRRLGELPAYDSISERQGVALVRIRG